MTFPSSALSASGAKFLVYFYSFLVLTKIFNTYTYVNDLRLTLGLNMDGGRAVLDVYRNNLSFGIYELRNCESI